MKIWRNKDKTKALRLDSVDYWEYTSAESLSQLANTGGALGNLVDMFTDGAILLMQVNGAEIHLSGDEADEVYKILKSQKEVL